MVPDALRHWLALVRVPGLGPVRTARLLSRHHSPAAVFAAGERAWAEAGCPEITRAALARPDLAAVEADLRWLDAPQRQFIAIDDPRYPPRLRQIAAAPIALFAVGDPELLALPQLGMVGARSASSGGRETAEAFAAELSRRGLVITSGLALGIDAAAHRGALSADGLTIAVCGNGLDRVYPARNRALAHEIAAQGLIVSEFPPGTAALPEHFPRRNRIISGLSLGVLVVEAAKESGSLITARLAAEQGREVFAIPGSIHNPLSRGTHALIRDGATLVETVDDVLEVLAPLLPDALRGSATAAPSPGAEPEDPLQQRVLAALGYEQRTIDELVAVLGQPVAAVTAALLALELDGRISAAPGDRFSRRG
jgi:DNA processing protein